MDWAAIWRDGFVEFREFVNPYIAERARLAGEPVLLARVEDGRLVDGDGRFVEDFHGTQALGHRSAAVERALAELLATDLPTWYPSRVNPFAGRLARRLCERSGHYDNAFFACTGSDSVEAALKLGRAVTGRPRHLGLDKAYHGCTYGSLSLMKPGPLRDPFAPHLPGAGSLPINDVAALERALAPGDVATVVVEPVQVEGGVRALSDEYVAALCEMTARSGTLLVADEVQTGLGRCGHFLLSSTWPRRPDAVCLAKTLGGGLAPVAAMLTRRSLFERAYGRNFETGEAHNTTFGNSGLTHALALAALEVLDDALIARVRETGDAFRAALAEAVGGSPLVADLRGRGLLVGVELVDLDHPWLSFEHFGFDGFEGRPVVGPILCHRMYRRGWFTFFCGHDWRVLRLLPRYTIEPETIARFCKDLREELDHLGSLT